MEKPDNWPDIVYKYRNWIDDFHKNVLRLNQLFFTSPKFFNDPFDCRITSNYSLINTPEKIEKFADIIAIRHFDRLVKEERDIKLELNKFENRLKDIKKVQEESDALFFDHQNKHTGVISLSERWDSILMWSHYADFHKGYCIGFYEEKMRNSGMFGKGGPVIYTSEFPQLDPIEDFSPKRSFIQSHSKSIDWAYEKEFRLTKILFPDIMTDAERIIVIPNEFIAEVMIGLDATQETRNEIVEICKLKGIKVYQVVKIPFKFNIDRIEIK